MNLYCQQGKKNILYLVIKLLICQNFITLSSYVNEHIKHKDQDVFQQPEVFLLIHSIIFHLEIWLIYVTWDDFQKFLIIQTFLIIRKVVWDSLGVVILNETQLYAVYLKALLVNIQASRLKAEAKNTFILKLCFWRELKCRKSLLLLSHSPLGAIKEQGKLKWLTGTTA